MMGCRKCMGFCAICFLVLGVLFLLRDLGVWDFWNIQWWTALFLLWGIGAFGMRSCPDCQAVIYGKKGK